MPIEISELVIKAKVADQQTPRNGTSGNQPQAEADPNNSGTLTPAERAVKEMADILKRKNDR